MKAVYLAGCLLVLGWGLRGLNWRAMRREPLLAGVFALAVVVLGALTWPLVPVGWWVLRRRGVLAVLVLALLANGCGTTAVPTCYCIAQFDHGVWHFDGYPDGVCDDCLCQIPGYEPEPCRRTT